MRNDCARSDNSRAISLDQYHYQLELSTGETLAMRGKIPGLSGLLPSFFISLFALAMIGLIGRTAGAQNTAAIVGRWDFTVQGTDAPYTSWLEVTDSGGTIQGRFVGRFGSVRPIKQIESKNGTLKFSLPPQFEKMKV